MSQAERRAAVAALTAEDRDSREIAAQLGCSQSTVVNDWQALGISRPPGRRAKHPPAPKDRTCETCGKPLEFRFPSDAYRREGDRLVERRYCSKECKDEGISKYPKPEPRACRRCGKTIHPLRAHGDQAYCSIECTRTGELVACAHCGDEGYLPGWAIRRGYRFCSHRCWGKQRWRDGIALAALIAGKGGRARREWKRRWRAPDVGKLGGRPAEYDDAQVRAVRAVKAKYPELGRVAIARLVSTGTGKPLTGDQVRGILKPLT
jgi:hypothetical protein